MNQPPQGSYVVLREGAQNSHTPGAPRRRARRSPVPPSGQLRAPPARGTLLAPERARKPFSYAVHSRTKRTHTLTLDPIKCTLCVKPGENRVLTSGQNQLFPSRGYTAETYAKVMGSSSPSQPRIKLKYTRLLFCLWIEVDGLVLPPIVYTVSPPLRGGVAFAPLTWVSPDTTTPSPTDEARGEASGEGRGWCAMLYVYKMPN